MSLSHIDCLTGEESVSCLDEDETLILYCFVFQWLKKTRRKALFASLEKMKEGMSIRPW